MFRVLQFHHSRLHKTWQNPALSYLHQQSKSTSNRPAPSICTGSYNLFKLESSKSARGEEMDQMPTTTFMLTHMLFVQAHTIAKKTCGRRGRFVEDKKKKKARSFAKPEVASLRPERSRTPSTPTGTLKSRGYRQPLWRRPEATAQSTPSRSFSSTIGTLLYFEKKKNDRIARSERQPPRRVNVKEGIAHCAEKYSLQFITGHWQ